MSGAAGLHPVGGAALVGPGGPAGRAARDDRAPEAIRSLEAWVLGALAGPARGLVAGAAARRRRVQLRRAAEQVQALLAQPAEVATPAALALAIRRDGFTGTAGVRLLAQVASRAISATGQRPWTTQLMAALALLDGCLAEMATGEGKTYAIALAAASAALAGRRVHVMTANDYLVQRDAERARPWFEALGLSCGAVLASQDAAERRAAWGCDVTYCVAREAAFDHMRDTRDGRHGAGGLERLAARLGGDAAAAADGPLLPVLDLALIDEADSQLIDDATLPLLLAAPAPADPQAAAQRRLLAFRALAVARGLQRGRDFELDEQGVTVRWTERGLAALEDCADVDDPAWRNRRHRRDQAELAIRALHGLVRDRDYVVRDDRVLLVDPATGRSAAGRAWSRGLHQLVEAKEGCALTEPTRVAARLSLQRFFGRYRSLAGITGTASEARRELHATFGLGVVAIPLRVRSRRSNGPLRLFADDAGRQAAVAARAAELLAAGRPVLVATDTVEQARALCAALTAHGLAASRLDALHDAHEAAVVAAAGQPRALTVATRMAGRGTDIELHPDARTAGGLHVIVCQDNPSGRLDRQVIGRCARAGDPGSAELWRTLEAAAWQPRPGLTGVLDRGVLALLRRVATAGRSAAWARIGRLASRWFEARQRHHERAGWRMRRLQLEDDLQWQTRVGSATPGQ